jgi:RNA polymerase sigma-70 factor (ECF subfamily)
MEDPQSDPGVRAMLAYQAGEEGAFDELVRAYSGQVYALLTRFLGPVPAREDLVQEVFLRVVRARERYQATARFSTWLYRIAFNLCVNERERLSGRVEVSLEAPGDPAFDAGAPAALADGAAPAPSDELERADAVAAVRAALAALPEAQRMALLLAKYEELSHAEIAEVMGSSEKAIKSLIHRARENLRAALRPFLQEDAA